MRAIRRCAGLVLLLSLAGCSRKQQGVQAHLEDHYPDKLSEWQLFVGNMRELKPNEGVLTYNVNTSLFSNHADKHRTVWIPAGTSATYKADGVLNLPVGAVLSKTFSFGDRRIETRLMIHKKNGWHAITYVWNADQTDANFDVTPAPVVATWQGQTFDYEIPNVNQCKACHEGPLDNAPLGITAKNLNRDGQLQAWVKAGYLKSLPASLPTPGTDLDSRARDYLAVNCATCHIVGGRGMKSKIDLSLAMHDAREMGLCGKQAKMIEVMTSHDPKVMMPPLGHSLVDQEGLELIRQWMSTIPKSTCPASS